MNSNEGIYVYYPKWMTALVIIGVPLLTVCAIWMSTRFIWEPGLNTSQYVISTLLGIAVLYQLSIGARCLFSLKTTIQIYDSGIELNVNNNKANYLWGDLDISEYAFATTTLLKTRKGQPLAYLSQGVPNLKLLKDGVLNDGFDA